LVEAKWTELNRFRESLETRHNATGHAMNYADRAIRIIDYMLEDVTHAFGRAKAVEAGLAGVFGKDIPLPELTKNGFLDNLVSWTRKVGYHLTIVTENRSIFEQVYSISLKPNNLPKSEAFSTAAQWTDGVKNGTFRFMIPPDFFPSELVNLRIVGLTLSCDYNSLTSANVGTHRTVLWKAVVFPPEQKNLYDRSGKSEIDSKAIILDSLSITEGKKPYHKSNAVQNIKPNGEWQVKVANYAFYGNRKDHGKRIRSGKLNDIKLHLLLASDFSSSEPSDWSEFWTK